MRTLVLLFGILTCVDTALADPTGLDIYVLAGQSNISGRDADFVVPAPYATDPAVLESWVFNDSWHQGRLRSDSPDGETRSVLVDHDKQVGISMSVTLAIGLRAAGDKPIGMVTCARGATTTQDWAPNGPLFAGCVERVREALPGNVLRGLVWYQGEADSRGGAAATAVFRQRTVEILQAFRQSLDQAQMPIVLVGLGDLDVPSAEPSYVAAWHEIQRLQSATELPCMAHISAAGLPLTLDGGHLSGAAQLSLGSAVAGAFASLRSQ